MSELRITTVFKRTFAASGLLALSMMSANAATDCHPLPAGFELCAPDWEIADIAFDAGDEIVVAELGAKWLEVMALPAALTDMPLHDALDVVFAANVADSAAEGLAAPEILNRQSFSTEFLNGAALTLSEEDFGDTYFFVTSVVEGGGRALLVSLDGDSAHDAAMLEAALRRVIDAIRPASEG